MPNYFSSSTCIGRHIGHTLQETIDPPGDAAHECPRTLSMIHEEVSPARWYRPWITRPLPEFTLHST